MDILLSNLLIAHYFIALSSLVRSHHVAAQMGMRRGVVVLGDVIFHVS